MTTQEVKAYLEKNLPEFTYITSEHEANQDKIWIEREGQHMVFDVSKVETEKEANRWKQQK